MLKLSAFTAPLLLAALYGCATSHVMVGQARAPVSPGPSADLLASAGQQICRNRAARYLEPWCVRDYGPRKDERRHGPAKGRSSQARRKRNTTGRSRRPSPLGRSARDTQPHPAIRHLDSAAPPPCTTRRAMASQFTSNLTRRPRVNAICISYAEDCRQLLSRGLVSRHRDGHHEPLSTCDPPHALPSRPQAALTWVAHGGRGRRAT